VLGALKLASVLIWFHYRRFSSHTHTKLVSTYSMDVTMREPDFVPLALYNFGQHGPFKRVTARLPWNPIVYCLIAAFHAITYWMCLELTIYVFCTFQRRSKLYFWYVAECLVGKLITLF
jgi:hypothetical protein